MLNHPGNRRQLLTAPHDPAIGPAEEMRNTLLELLIEKFNGFEATDFDAYRPEKWQSNLYNGERLRVRQKMEALGKALQPKMSGQVGLPLGLETSSDRPCLWNQKSVHCQWLCLLRPVEIQKTLEASHGFRGPLVQTVTDPAAYNRHAFLGLKLDMNGIEVAWQVNGMASADAGTMASAMLPSSTTYNTISALLKGLGDEYAVKIVGNRPGEAHEWPANAAPMDQIAQTAAIGDFSSISISRFLPRAQVEGTEEQGFEAITSELEKLAPIYKLLVWHEENDLINLKEAMARQDEERSKRREAEERERERKEEERRLRAQEARRRTEEQEKERRDAEYVLRRLAEEQLRYRLQKEQEAAEQAAASAARAGNLAEAPVTAGAGAEILPPPSQNIRAESGAPGDGDSHGVETTGIAASTESAAASESTTATSSLKAVSSLGTAAEGKPDPNVKKGVYWTEAGKQLFEARQKSAELRASQTTSEEGRRGDNDDRTGGRRGQRAGTQSPLSSSKNKSGQGGRHQDGSPAAPRNQRSTGEGRSSRPNSVFTSAPAPTNKADDFAVGNQVMLNRGLFAGRLGTLKSLAGRKAKVEVGGLMVNMELGDLKKTE